MLYMGCKQGFRKHTGAATEKEYHSRKGSKEMYSELNHNFKVSQTH